jgi:hypothetical protein
MGQVKLPIRIGKLLTMTMMFKFFFLIFSLAMLSPAHACTCSFSQPAGDSLRHAKNVFIFQLTEAKLSSTDTQTGMGPAVTGSIKVVQQLQGHSRNIKQMVFSTSRCCGARFDVGGLFVAFVNSQGHRFEGSSGNVIEIEPGLAVPDAAAAIRAFLRNEKTLEEIFPRMVRDRTEQSPVAPPCPRQE